jgi:hypothetical protein
MLVSSFRILQLSHRLVLSSSKFNNEFHYFRKFERMCWDFQKLREFQYSALSEKLPILRRLLMVLGGRLFWNSSAVFDVPYEGGSFESNILLNQKTGASSSFSVSLPRSRRLLVHFHSDYSLADRGFRAIFQVVGRSFCANELKVVLINELNEFTTPGLRDHCSITEIKGPVFGTVD